MAMDKNAMINMTIAPQKAQLERARRELIGIKDGFPKALSAAINKTATGAKTDLVRELAKVYTAKQKSFREAVSIGKKATPKALEATVVGKRHRAILLTDFKVKPRRPTHPRPSGGLTVEVKRGQIKKLPYSFIAAIQGRMEAAERVHRRKRLPIRPLYGPPVPTMMDNDRVVETVLEGAGKRLEKALDHEITRVERGWGG